MADSEALESESPSPESPSPDSLWETHSQWWQDGFTDGADVEYEEQILPLAQALLEGYDRVLDFGAGEGQISRLLSAAGSRVVGVDPTRSQIAVARARSLDAQSPDDPVAVIVHPQYAVADGAHLPHGDASFDAVVGCLVFEHIDPLEPAVAEVARVLQPGGRFALFLNHPLLQTPGSGWIDDHMVDPPDQYWRIGPYLVESHLVEEVHKDVFIPFVHRPLHRYINTLSAHGLMVREMHEPSPPQGFLDKSAYYLAAAAIPRLLVLVCERE